MTTKVKKEQRTLTMSADVWAYIDQLTPLTDRTYSQEIEYALKQIKKRREASDLAAANMADLHTPPQD